MSCGCFSGRRGILSLWRSNPKPQATKPCPQIQIPNTQEVSSLRISDPRQAKSNARGSEKSLSNKRLSTTNTCLARYSGKTFTPSENSTGSIRSVDGKRRVNTEPSLPPTDNSTHVRQDDSPNARVVAANTTPIHIAIESPTPTTPSNKERLTVVIPTDDCGLRAPTSHSSHRTQSNTPGDGSSMEYKIGTSSSTSMLIASPAISSDEVETPRQLNLEDRLFAAQLQSPTDEMRYFIPENKLASLITTVSIGEELSRHLAPSSSIDRGRLEIIHETAPKLFSILVLLQKSAIIQDFLDEGFGDVDLPFTRAHNKLCSSESSTRPVHCTETWRPQEIQKFCEWQWTVMAPIFRHSSEIQHHIFHDNCVLPFLKDKERSSEAKVGGFGTVWEVEIHPAHQSLLRNIASDPHEQPSFALKKLHSNQKDDFDSEVRMLKAMSSHKHAHLVKLLATYEYKGSYYLLFPYAKANLRTYWQNTALPEFSHSTALWVLSQCKGLASGLLRIHGYKTTFDYTKSTSQFPPGSAVGDDVTQNVHRTYGRHGDIKPENILWTIEDVNDEGGHLCEEGFLLIADFGLMRIHGDLSKSLQHPDKITGSPTYQPPELKMHCNISRAYDIWSLGCVYLEFMTWLVGGWDHLTRFSHVRSIGRDGTNDDAFFTIEEDTTRHRQAIVRPAVQKWITELHEMPRCSDFIHEFLTLISNHMLMVDPQHRFECGRLNRKLSEMVRKATKDRKYLLDGNPYPHQVPTNSELHGPITPRGRNNVPALNTGRGTPLPKRANTFDSSAALARRRPQSLAWLPWSAISPPSSPILSHPL